MWDRVIDVADIVTAISAVVGVIIAAKLGVQGVRIAARDATRGEREFVMGQAHHLTEAGVAFTRAVAALARDEKTQTSGAERLETQLSHLTARLDTLIEMSLIDREDKDVDSVKQFIETAERAATSVHRLQTAGPSILARTVFDGEADLADVLRWMASKVHGHDAYVDCGIEMAASDGWGVSTAFDDSREIAAQLRRDALEATTGLSVNESLRLVVPWLLIELDWLEVAQAPDDEYPTSVTENNWGLFHNEETGEVVIPEHGFAEVRDWLDVWLRDNFHRIEDHGRYSEDNFQGSSVSPNALAVQLLDGLSDELTDRLRSVVRGMGSRISERG